MTTCPHGHNITWLIGGFGLCSVKPGQGYGLYTADTYTPWRKTTPEIHPHEWFWEPTSGFWHGPEFSSRESAMAWIMETIDLESRAVHPPFVTDHRAQLDRALEALRAIADCDEQGHDGLLWAMGEARLALADIESIEEPA